MLCENPAVCAGERERDSVTGPCIDFWAKPHCVQCQPNALKVIEVNMSLNKKKKKKR